MREFTMRANKKCAFMMRNFIVLAASLSAIASLNPALGMTTQDQAVNRPVSSAVVLARAGKTSTVPSSKLGNSTSSAVKAAKPADAKVPILRGGKELHLGPR